MRRIFHGKIFPLVIIELCVKKKNNNKDNKIEIFVFVLFSFCVH